MTKENVIFDTTTSRYDVAIKEVEERVKLGWSVKASFLIGGGYIRVDYIRHNPNSYADAGKTNESKVDVEKTLSGVGDTKVSDTAEEKAVEQKPKPTRKTSTKKVEVKEDDE